MRQILKTANEILYGKDEELKLAFCCLFAKGHLLIEDVPGVGKTTLAKLLSASFHLKMNRIQFTSDLLPSDLLGVSVYHEGSASFQFHPGPLFSELILADELNRASPKTQSACLQAMEEGEITVDGKTYPLPKPFLFIATQNPVQSIGTFPIPDSQLDRFLMKIKMGYPSSETEMKLLQSANEGRFSQEQLKSLKSELKAEDLIKIQIAVDQVTSKDSILQYILDLVQESRVHGEGLSPRAGLDLLRAAKAWAYSEERNYLIPEDVKAIAFAVMNHRVRSVETIIQNVPLR